MDYWIYELLFVPIRTMMCLIICDMICHRYIIRYIKKNDNNK